MAPLHILLATDGSAEAAASVELVQFLPLPSGSTVHVLSVAHTSVATASWSRSPALEALLRFEREDSEAAVQSAAAALAQEEVIVTGEVREEEPAQAILNTAREQSADLILLGAKGRSGLAGFLLGSVSRAVIQRSSCPVLITRHPHNDLRAVVLAVDGSEQAIRATEFLTRFPLPETTEILVTYILSSYEPPPASSAVLEPLDPASLPMSEPGEDRGYAVCETARRALASAGLRAKIELRAGKPADEIRGIAEEGRADIVVVGFRQRARVEALWEDSVAEQILAETHCSLLLVR